MRLFAKVSQRQKSSHKGRVLPCCCDDKRVIVMRDIWCAKTPVWCLVRVFFRRFGIEIMKERANSRRGNSTDTIRRYNTSDGIAHMGIREVSSV